MDDMMKKLGRILYAIPMVLFGIMHFPFAGKMAGMVPSYVPGGVLWVYITGLALLAAGISIIIEKYDRLAAQLLALLMGIFVLTIHLPGLMAGGEMAGYAIGNLLKDVGLLAGALIIASISKK